MSIISKVVRRIAEAKAKRAAEKQQPKLSLDERMILLRAINTVATLHKIEHPNQTLDFALGYRIALQKALTSLLQIHDDGK